MIDRQWEYMSLTQQTFRAWNAWWSTDESIGFQNDFEDMPMEVQRTVAASDVPEDLFWRVVDEAVELTHNSLFAAYDLAGHLRILERLIKLTQSEDSVPTADYFYDDLETLRHRNPKPDVVAKWRELARADVNPPAP